MKNKTGSLPPKTTNKELVAKSFILHLSVKDVATAVEPLNDTEWKIDPVLSCTPNG